MYKLWLTDVFLIKPLKAFLLYFFLFCLSFDFDELTRESAHFSLYKFDRVKLIWKKWAVLLSTMWTGINYLIQIFPGELCLLLQSELLSFRRAQVDYDWR